MLQIDALRGISGQKSCFLRAKSSNFHEKISSGISLVPKSRFYRFCMTFGIPNDLLLMILGGAWPPQGGPWVPPRCSN